MLHVVVDTDFLSAFLKIHQIELIRSFFQVEELLVPPAVYREVAVTTLLPEVVASESIRVQEIEQKEKRL